MEASRRNQFIPVFPTGQAEKMQRLYSKADIPWDELLEYYRKLKETTISD